MGLGKGEPDTGKRYKKAGITFARTTLPGVMILGTGGVALMAIGPFAAGAATAAAAASPIDPPVRRTQRMHVRKRYARSTRCSALTSSDASAMIFWHSSGDKFRRTSAPPDAKLRLS